MVYNNINDVFSEVDIMSNSPYSEYEKDFLGKKNIKY